MKKCISLLLVFMLMMIGTSSLVQAQDPVGNEVQVSFSTVYLYELPEDSFTNPLPENPVQGDLSWCSVFSNSPDGSGQPAQNVTLHLETGQNFDRIGPPPDPDSHYTWSFGEIPPGPWGQVVSVEYESNPQDFIPCFDISRDVSTTEFSVTGEQTVIVSITPKEDLPNIKIYVSALENEFVNPEITSAVANQTSTEIIQISGDKRQLLIDIFDPSINTPYEYEVKIMVNLKPGTTTATFMPRVEGHWLEEQAPGSSFTETNGAGTWTWSADGVDVWYSNVNTSRMVRLMEYSGGEREGVLLLSHEMYSYIATEDTFLNQYVFGYRTWGTNLSYYCTDPSKYIDWATIGLETTEEFAEMNTNNLEQSPSEPFAYQWSYTEIPSQSDVGTYVSYGPDDQSPVPFEPGYNASRTLINTRFESPGTQTLIIHVAPQEMPFPWFGINVRIPGDLSFGTNAQITGCTGANEYNLQEDGQDLNIWQSEPIPGVDYWYTITIQVEPGDFPIEIEPFVEIISTPGGSPSTYEGVNSIYDIEIDNLGTWTWKMSAAYHMSVANDLNYAVRWEPRYEVFINDVTVLFQTFHAYVSGEDIFENPEDGGTIEGNEFWMTQILNLPDNTGEPISSATLVLDTNKDFLKVKPPVEGPPYEWLYNDITVWEVYWASVESPNPVDFSPGFDASRSVNRILFSEPGTQILTIEVTPREENMGTIIIDVFSADDENVNAVIDSFTGADMVFTGNDGHHLMMVKGGPVINEPYQFTVEIEITPMQPQISYLPKVRIYTYLPEEQEPTTGSSFEYDITGTGADIWTWSATENYRWNWDAGTVRAVVFPEYFGEVMEEFVVESMSIDFYDKPDSDKMVGSGIIRLNANTTYDFAVDDVVLNIDGVIISIPAGSFIKKNNSESYQYKSDGGIDPQVELEFDFETGEWRLKVNNIDASIINNSDGVDFILSIGDIWGGQVIDMRVGGLTFIAGE